MLCTILTYALFMQNKNSLLLFLLLYTKCTTNFLHQQFILIAPFYFAD